MDLSKIDFQQLRVRHIFFKTKVRALLYGAVYDAAFFSTKGPVGDWFSSVGSVRYANEPEIAELEKIHSNLNLAALALFRLYTDGLIDQAHDGLKGIDLLSDQFLALLTKMELRLVKV